MLAAISAALVSLLFNGATRSPQWQVVAPVAFVLTSTLMFALLRLGLVAAIAAMFFLNDANSITAGTDWTTWYAPYGFATLAMLLGIALLAFRTSLGSRERFSCRTGYDLNHGVVDL